MQQELLVIPLGKPLGASPPSLHIPLFESRLQAASEPPWLAALCKRPVLAPLFYIDNSSRDQRLELIQLEGPHHSFMRRGRLMRSCRRGISLCVLC